MQKGAQEPLCIEKIVNFVRASSFCGVVSRCVVLRLSAGGERRRAPGRYYHIVEIHNPKTYAMRYFPKLKHFAFALGVMLGICTAPVVLTSCSEVIDKSNLVVKSELTAADYISQNPANRD